jgi:DNA-binding CsgD family transcriptional regulator
MSQKRLPPSTTPAFSGCVLSPSELQALRLMATGLTYAQAAEQSGRATSTIRSLLHSAYQRLGVTTIAQALSVCSQAGWLDPVSGDGSVVALADRRVTWAQRLYLEAFDQSLRAGDDPAEAERTERLRDASLTGMYREVHKNRPWRAAERDPIERLARDLKRLALRRAA